MLHALTLVLLTPIICPEAELSDKKKKSFVPSTIELGTISELG
jgi:hypothetical protein